MFGFVKSTTVFACAFGAMASIPASVNADQIALTFTQHDLLIVGDFAGFEDNQYVVETANGTIHVPAALVICEGDDCVNTVVAAVTN